MFYKRDNQGELKYNPNIVKYWWVGEDGSSGHGKWYYTRLAKKDVLFKLNNIQVK